MTVSVEQVADWMRVPDDRVHEIEEFLTAAQEMVDQFVGDTVIPESILDLAVMRVTSNLWNDDGLPVSTNSFYGVDTGNAIPAMRDPMTGAYILLRKWVSPW
jgi:hypothetical protein